MITCLCFKEKFDLSVVANYLSAGFLCSPLIFFPQQKILAEKAYEWLDHE